MPRVLSTLLLIGGAVLLLTWIVSPASSSPQQGPAAAQVSADLAASMLLDLNGELDRLHARLTPPPAFPPPARDPFNFGRRSTVASVPAAAPIATAPVAKPIFPRLVAILEGANGEHRAVFPSGDDVEIVGIGEATGSFLVKEISADAAMLVDRTSGESASVTLR